LISGEHRQIPVTK